MAKTLIQNQTSGAISLPLPYRGVIPPAPGAAVVDGTPEDVVTALGGAAAVGGSLRFTILFDSTPLTPHDGGAAAMEAALLRATSTTFNLGGKRATNAADPVGAQDLATQAWALNVAAPSASETVQGKAELATQAEVNTGTDDLRIVTPLKLANASALVRKAAANVGDGVLLTIDVTHNLGTRDVTVEVYRNSAPWDRHATVAVEHLSTSQIRLIFLVAPTAAEFRVVIHG